MKKCKFWDICGTGREYHPCPPDTDGNCNIKSYPSWGKGKKPKLEIETQGRCAQVENAFVAKTKYGYYLEVSTKDKRPDCNCMSGRDEKGEYSGISFFTDNGVQLVKVYGEWDAVLYNVRYGATVILLPKDYFKNGTVVAELPKGAK